MEAAGGNRDEADDRYIAAVSDGRRETISQSIARWIADGSTASESGRPDYERMSARHIEAHIGHKATEVLTHDDVLTLVRATWKAMAPKTAKNHLAIIFGALDLAVCRQVVTTNVATPSPSDVSLSRAATAT
ncbi:hypothetical protein [Brevibacterium sp. HMSC063G07]|uniref:hypothetical protein n=1 Tax=Brevibacterium sp. HMSC063G07 TaxID=1739261 RepID=UPI0008A1385D|nr:hypothetical protein [Brevibacterium sp. HMSC063G07]OFL64109.1 hypothetical protein HMPREF2757_01210 [Brevibacterium sp. HMSC063G07]